MNRLILCFSLFLLAPAGFTQEESAADPAMAGPRAQVEDDIGTVIRILKDRTLDRDTRWEKIAEVMYGRFDFESMSQSVLARNWQDASPEEREQFVDYFSKYLENVYREKIERYTNQDVEYVHETMVDDRAVVDTVIVAGDTRIPVTYKLKDTMGEWLIYDVVIEGLSLVNNYRDTYGQKIHQDGMQALLADLKGQLDDYRAADMPTLEQ